MCALQHDPCRAANEEFDVRLRGLDVMVASYPVGPGRLRQSGSSGSAAGSNRGDIGVAVVTHAGRSRAHPIEGGGAGRSLIGDAARDVAGPTGPSLFALGVEHHFAGGGFTDELFEHAAMSVQVPLRHLHLDREGDPAIIDHPGLRMVDGDVSADPLAGSREDEPGAFSKRELGKAANAHWMSLSLRSDCASIFMRAEQKPPPYFFVSFLEGPTSKAHWRPCITAAWAHALDLSSNRPAHEGTRLAPIAHDGGPPPEDDDHEAPA